MFLFNRTKKDSSSPSAPEPSSPSDVEPSSNIEQNPSANMPLNPQSLNKTVAAQELAIAISAKNLNPQMLNLEFLKMSGIIGNDWELAKKPVVTPRAAQVSFKNGVTIIAQPGVISFSEGIGKKSTQELNSSQVASRYINKLSQGEYQAISIAPKLLFALSDNQEAAKTYLMESLLAPGSWQEYGQGIVQASLNFVYQLERCQLNLTINQIRLQQQEKPWIPGLLFSGSFNYNVSDKLETERISQMQQHIDRWSTDFESFNELVNGRFWGDTESVFPSAS